MNQPDTPMVYDHLDDDYCLVDSIPPRLEDGREHPLQYLRRWVSIDCRDQTERDSWLRQLEADLLGRVSYDYESFCRAYEKVEAALGPLGRVAYLVVRTHYLLGDRR